jgi:hypothetical protein
MPKEKSDNPIPTGMESNNHRNDLPGYPSSPESEDIYDNFLKESDINPEDVRKNKELNENDIEDKYQDHDLDIPGSELDDEMENIGSEDEENNYYSIGGDDHDDLDENQGE